MNLGFPCTHLQVRARIEVAVLNFLKTLTAPNPAVSNLALVGLFLDLQAREGFRAFPLILDSFLDVLIKRQLRY